MSDDTLAALRAVRQDIGRLIRRAREERGWTQAELGKHWMGVSHAAISDIERGVTGLDVYDLMRAADVFRIDWHELLPNGPAPEQAVPQETVGMAEEQEHKTLGQVAYEVMHHGHYSALPPAEQGRWESVAQAVKEAVLAEQDTPQRLKDMDHATTMRDRAIRELKEGLAAINRAFVYRDALEQELAEIEARLALEPR